MAQWAWNCLLSGHKMDPIWMWTREISVVLFWETHFLHKLERFVLRCAPVQTDEKTGCSGKKGFQKKGSFVAEEHQNFFRSSAAFAPFCYSLLCARQPCLLHKMDCCGTSTVTGNPPGPYCIKLGFARNVGITESVNTDLRRTKQATSWDRLSSSQIHF